MTTIKALSAPELAETAAIYKVLSNPTRIRILYALENNELDVSSIVKVLELDQPSVSHQLAVLKKHQLVAFTKVGKHVLYRLDDPHILEVIEATIAHVKHVILGLPHGVEDKQD
ncbi:ArsR/SmtB family transcription factor [Periweissella fabalis]|uniref:Winged helix-turn-helix transcriptional regulator n=1 Tax=Periweissella fabalis TaxID=1070421 RepID=A0A7X6N2W4_9LACO|nr:metalloregulator ArsR/SmtB family transcription factor [Periweissella fabalis]MCM0599433.1 winged helix-turn-helix transcriptional regulator [Periweissella fabalis]NKZ23712.1 winged helix-turn-helix transcriptional regulator [Periweissella fabalis]